MRDAGHPSLTHRAEAAAAAAAAALQSAPAAPPPYQFGQPDTDATIVIAKEPDASGELVKQVKYATVEKAVEHLTFPLEHCPGYGDVHICHRGRL